MKGGSEARERFSGERPQHSVRCIEIRGQHSASCQFESDVLGSPAVFLMASRVVYPRPLGCPSRHSGRFGFVRCLLCYTIYNVVSTQNALVLKINCSRFHAAFFTRPRRPCARNCVVIAYSDPGPALSAGHAQAFAGRVWRYLLCRSRLIFFFMTAHCLSTHF